MRLNPVEIEFVGNRKSKTLAAVVKGCIAVLALASCSAEMRQNVLKSIFDVSDRPPVPTQRVRRDLLQEIDELKRKLAETERNLAAEREAAKAGKAAQRVVPPIEKATTWEAAVKMLPKDNSGHVDWVQALKLGTIRPRPGPGPQAPEQATLDFDVEIGSSANKLFHVTYPHRVHTEQLGCNACHPTIFPLRQAKPTIITMAKIQAGQYCGVCHGKVAFGVENECTRCHARGAPAVEWHAPEPRKPIERAKTWEEAVKVLPATAGVPDWAKALNDGIIAPQPGIDPKAADQPVLPLDVELVPAVGAMFKVIFPHKTHTQWLGCPNCHTVIFQMAKGADPITMEKINAGQYCGVCHGKVAFSTSACGRCHPAMAGGKS